MSPEEKKEQEKVIKEIEEMTLLKANVKWLKLKHGDMHSEVKSIRIALTDLTNRLFIDEKTGEDGYFAIIKDLLKKHYETNKRVDRLENIKKAVIGVFLFGFTVIGIFIKTIWNYIKQN